MTDQAFEMFFRSYVGTALWSSTDPDDDDRPLDDGRDIDDVEESSLADMRRDCWDFYTANINAIQCDDAPLSSEFDGPIAQRKAAMAGHDFWLTRNGHGAGFWDGDWPEPYADILDKASKAMGEVYLFVNDDGKIHQG